MPLVVTKLENLPPSTRNKKRALEDTEEWMQLKAKLAEGLKPYEVVYVTFTPEQQRELGVRTAGRIFRQMTLDYIRKIGLQYDCWRYRSEGKEVVAIAGREAHGKGGVQQIAAGTGEREEREEREGRALANATMATRRKKTGTTGKKR